MERLDGRVALVTGASRGIGAAVARQLADGGVRLGLASRSGDDLGIPGAVAMPTDVRDPAALEAIVAATVEAFGRLDILVVNAGVGGYGSFLDLDPDVLEEMIDVNVKGALYSIRAALPHLLRSDAADLVTIASEAGRRGLPYEATYCASKFAQVGLTRALDHELREKGVRCTNVCPGGVAHRLRDGSRPDARHAGARRDDGGRRRRRRGHVRPHAAASPPDPRGRPPAGHRDVVGLIAVRTLRWGILSTANIATEKVIPGILAADRCEIVAIGSRDQVRGRAAAERHGIARVHGSYEDLLADPDVDAVYIPLPNHLHAEWTMAAAWAGKHVLCEKPLAMTASDAERMIEGCEKAGVVLMEAFMYRLHPSWVAVRELVAGGRIGRLTAVDTWFSYFNDDPANIRNIREYGGGALFDIGCYPVNLSRMLFGGEPEHVAATVIRDPASGVDVLTSGILEFPAGVADVHLRRSGPRTTSASTSTGRPDASRSAIPFNIPPDLPTEVRVIAGGDPPVAPAFETLTFAPADPYAVEAAAFAAAVLDGTPLPTPPQDAVANLRVIERLFAAGERG